MVDAGTPGKIKLFKRKLRTLLIYPKDIKLLILTHGHYDHVGNAKEISELTGAKIAIHKKESSWLATGFQALTPGKRFWPRIFGFLLRLLLPFNKFSPCMPAILLDGDMDLASFGVDGKVINTPGHSGGSVSVILDNGFAFLGDLAMNGLPLRKGAGLSIFIENKSEILSSVETLIESGISTIYPAHGKPFSIDLLKKE
jgi:glyoxylase-like metal-dependent hydrolase (beta-lactamase superfamily II)